MKKKIIIILFILINFTLFAKEKNSFLNQPLQIKNQYLFYQNHLQLSLQSTNVLPKNINEFKLSFYKGTTHSYLYDSGGNSIFALDLETTTYTLQYSRNIGLGIEMNTAWPLVIHSGGMLDAFTEDWHSAFGLPNGGREKEPHNKMLIKINGLLIDDAFTGIGDPTFSFKKTLMKSKISTALNLSFKLPLSTQGFIGTRTFDVGLSVLNDVYLTHWLYMYSSIGCVVIIGKPYYDEALNYSNRVLLQVGYGFAAQVFKPLTLFMQLFAQGSPYNSGYEVVDSTSWVHSFGVRWQLDPSLILQISMDEDTFGVLKGTDYSFNFQLEGRF